MNPPKGCFNRASRSLQTLRRFSLFVASGTALALLACANAFAQSVTPRASDAASKAATAKNDKDDETIRLQDMVVSGTVEPRRQLDNAAAVTTIDLQQIKYFAPNGLTDLLKMVPGIYAVTANGETRANVYARGYPVGAFGGYTFIGLQEDGLPAISEGGIRISIPDQFTRLTPMVERVEVVRGGTSAVFQNNAPGGIMNFISREGGTARQGELAFGTSDYNQLKVNLWASGPAGENTFYAVALGYRRDDGQRPIGYTANDGGFILANLKHVLANGRGYVKISGKWMDERNVFYVTTPLRDGLAPKTIPGGPDISKGTNLSADLRHSVSIPSSPDGPLNPDLADGSHVPLGYIGVDFRYKLTDGLSLSLRGRYTNLRYNQAVLLLSSAATPLQALVNSIGSGAGSQFANAIASGGNYRHRLSYPGAAGVVIADPSTLNGNGLGYLQQLSTSVYKIGNYQYDVRLQKSIGDTGNLTAGLYLASLKIRAFAWGYTPLTEVKNQPRRLDVEFLDAQGASLGYGTHQGVRQVSPAGNYRNNSASHKDLAPFLNIEQHYGDWSFDAGVRHERKKETVSVAVPQSYNLNPPGQNNPALRNATFGSGRFHTASYDVSASTWTAAANYTFNKRFSAYTRYTNTYRLPISDDFLNAAMARSADPGPTNRIAQLEAGIKFSSRKVAIFATVVDSRLKKQLFSGFKTQPDGSVVVQSWQRDTSGVSFELEAFWTPLDSLSFHFVGTQQKQKYTSDTFVRGIDGAGKTITVNINGKRPFELPDRYFTLGAVYKAPEIALGRFSFSAEWQNIGTRPNDEANLTWLNGYDAFACGILLSKGRYTYHLHVQNVFNSAGLTNGDARAALFFGDPSTAYVNARVILPRAVTASMSIAF